MTVKSLRETLSELPSDMDDFEVFFCAKIEDDGPDRAVSFDEPICGSMVPEGRKIYYLLSEESMNYLAELAPEIGEEGKWVQGKI